MQDPITSPDDQYAALVATLLNHSDVTHATDGSPVKQGFGANALKVRGKIFAMLVRSQLVVKLPKLRVDALIAAQQGERFDPRHDGRLMKEWLVVAYGGEADWLSLSREALAYVGGYD